MPAHQGNAQFPTSLPELGKNLSHEGLCGTHLGQQQGGEEPAWCTPHDGNIVGIHRHRIVPDGISGKSNGVRFGDEQPVTHINDSGIFADTWTNKHAWISEDFLPQQLGKKCHGKLAWRERGRIHEASIWRPGRYWSRSATLARTRSAPCASSLAVVLLPDSTPTENIPRALPAWISIAPSPTIMARAGVVPRQSRAACRWAGCGLTRVTRSRGMKAWQ